MSPDVCPPPNVLRRLLLGELSDGESARTAIHLEHCPACLKALQRLEVDDPLLAAMRKQGTAPPPKADSLVKQIVVKLQSDGAVDDHRELPGVKSAAAADRNLLFGILALQNNLIDRHALVSAFDRWVTDKSQPLGAILVAAKALQADERELLDALVDRHLQRFGGDVEKSLAAVSSLSSVRDDLGRIADPDLQSGLERTVRRVADEGADPWQTQQPSVGDATSQGTRFRILRPHAKGGLGQIYVAEDAELHRLVALKEIQSRHADHPDSRSRFVLEAEITGSLEHPGIVPVYGLGTYADGRPFYAMRFIKGDSLQEAIKRFHAADSKSAATPAQRNLELRKLLGRFLDVCNAIDYAHSRGVLHRDLKPGNIMLGQYGETLVVDWGLAKALGKSATVVSDATTIDPPIQPSSSSGSATVAGSAVGTPHYMSPEQAAGRLDLLGPASDVYSLGATLYCVLTGRAPFPRELETAEVLRLVQAGEFTRPRQVNPDVAPALEAVCLKAMALKSSQRYATPRALAEEIERWLADEPVTAYREPLRVRLARWRRRHHTLVTGVGVLLVATIVSLGVGIALLGKKQAEIVAERNAARIAEAVAANAAVVAQDAQAKEVEERKRANDERDAAEWTAYLAHIQAADAEWDRNQAASAFFHLKACVGKLRGWEYDYLDAKFRRGQESLRGHGWDVRSAAFSPDSTRIVSGGGDSDVKLWDVATGAETLTLRGHRSCVQSVAFSPDGKRIVSGSLDRTVKLWDAATGAETMPCAGIPALCGAWLLVRMARG